MNWMQAMAKIQSYIFGHIKQDFQFKNILSIYGPEITLKNGDKYIIKIEKI